MARLFADESFPRPVVDGLRAAGHDVLTLQQTGEGGRSLPDDEVLARAAADGRAVLTMNRKHFMRLHRDKPAHAGVIVCTFDPDFARQALRIDAAITSVGPLPGQLVRVNRLDH
ncbi:MAG: DUF5615 family PIN-like protein [Minicystis sp.]